MHDIGHIAVIDFGSQTTMLIARRIRELGVFAKVLPPTISAQALALDPPLAIILSGGPESLLEPNAIRLDREVFSMGLPMLGICYGMQLMVEHFGGALSKADEREFGKRLVTVDTTSALFDGLHLEASVWMSHCDQVSLPPNFRTIASSSTCPHAAVACSEQKLYGVQFHPEVSHTECGTHILSQFIFSIAGIKRNFAIHDWLHQAVEKIKAEVGDAHVIMGLSGGVDSSVAAVLIHRAIKERLHCVYVNHGLHRMHEIEEVKALFGDVLNMNLHIVDAQEQFFAALAQVSDPEMKRKIIGHTFIDVFEMEARRFPDVAFLGQGTLYPDVIESQSSASGVAHVIKSHHNVGGLPERMQLKLIEPLRDLFKDEVRKLGSLLGLPDHVINRQPFPGPGLAVRIPGEVTRERVNLLMHADMIVREEIERAQVNHTLSLWQWFAILLPVHSVGVMGDARSYGQTIVIRCVESDDAMTADWAKLPYDLLGVISSRITNEVSGISRVLYDVTQKPPGTIEWE